MTKRELKNHVRGEINDLAQSLTRLKELSAHDPRIPSDVAGSITSADKCVDILLKVSRRWWK